MKRFWINKILIIAATFLIVGCATQLTSTFKTNPEVKFPANFKALTRITFISHNHRYEWTGYAMTRDRGSLLVQIMEPSGSPVLQFSVTKDDGFKVIQKGILPEIEDIDEKLARCFQGVFLLKASHINSAIRIQYSDNQSKIQYIDSESQYEINIQILEMKTASSQ